MSKITYTNQFDINEVQTLHVPKVVLDEWEDISWGNCTCPCFTNARLKLAVWIDFDDPSCREFEDDDKKYTIVDCLDPEEGTTGDTDIFATNDEAEFLNFIETWPLKEEMRHANEALSNLFEALTSSYAKHPLAEKWLPYVESALDDINTAIHS